MLQPLMCMTIDKQPLACREADTNLSEAAFVDATVQVHKAHVTLRVGSQRRDLVTEQTLPLAIVDLSDQSANLA